LRAKKVTKEGTKGRGSSDPPLPLTPPFQTAEGVPPSVPSLVHRNGIACFVGALYARYKISFKFLFFSFEVFGEFKRGFFQKASLIKKPPASYLQVVFFYL